MWDICDCHISLSQGDLLTTYTLHFFKATQAVNRGWTFWWWNNTPHSESQILNDIFASLFCQHLNIRCVSVYLELSCGKSSMSVVLIPEKQTTDSSVSFWDYLDSCSTRGNPIPFEMCAHMLKCQKMSLQSTL